MQNAGYTVSYVLPHSGFTKSIYWAPDLHEVRQYAQWVVRNFGKTHDVFISTADGAKLCEWTLANPDRPPVDQAFSEGHCG